MLPRCNATGCRLARLTLRGLSHPLSTLAPPPQPSPWWVATINGALAAQPVATLGAYSALDFGGIMGLFALYSAAEVEVPVELALAYGASRLLRRVRLPVDLAAAAVLARAVPALTEVRIMEAIQRSMSLSSSSSSTSTSTSTTSALQQQPSTALGRMLAGAGDLVNRYGLAYMVASRCIVGLGSVGTIFACLRAGMDVQAAVAALEAWSPVPTGLAEAGAAAGKAAGWWAAAALTSAPLLPANLMLAALVGQRVNQYRQGGG